MIFLEFFFNGAAAEIGYDLHFVLWLYLQFECEIIFSKALNNMQQFSAGGKTPDRIFFILNTFAERSNLCEHFTKFV
jgi:hypothetical protein